MNSRALGATKVFAWEGAEVAVMGAVAAIRILHRRKLAEVSPEIRPQVEAELAAEHERLAGGVDKAAGDRRGRRGRRPGRTPARAIARAIDDAVQATAYAGARTATSRSDATRTPRDGAVVPVDPRGGHAQSRGSSAGACLATVALIALDGTRRGRDHQYGTSRTGGAAPLPSRPTSWPVTTVLETWLYDSPWIAAPARPAVGRGRRLPSTVVPGGSPSGRGYRYTPGAPDDPASTRWFAGALPARRSDLRPRGGASAPARPRRRGGTSRARRPTACRAACRSRAGAWCRRARP